MSRQITHDQRMRLEQNNTQFPEALSRIHDPEIGASSRAPLRVWRSRRFLVQMFEAPMPAMARLTINRTSLDSEGGWLQDITWDDIQRLKGEAGFGDMWAVEIYPADKDVVNRANMRHIFLLPEAPAFGWKA